MIMSCHHIWEMFVLPALSLDSVLRSVLLLLCMWTRSVSAWLVSEFVATVLC